MLHFIVYIYIKSGTRMLLFVNVSYCFCHLLVIFLKTNKPLVALWSFFEVALWITRKPVASLLLAS